MGILTGLTENRSAVHSGFHPRDPALAALWGGGWATEAGISVTPENAMRAPAVAASVRLLSETVATIPLDLLEADGDSWRRATEHRYHRIVHDQPNEWLSSTDWRRRKMNGLLLRGNQYNRISWGGDGTVQKLDPLPKSGVTPFRADNRIWYRVFEKGSSYVLPAMEVLHFRGPFQEGDELTARSPVEVGKDLIAQSIAAASFIARFFQNGATPKLNLEIPGTITDADTIKMLRDRFEERHRGLENAHKLAITEMGMKLTPISIKNNDAELLGIYKQSALEIGSRLYGIPPHLAGDIEKQSSWGTGIESMDIGYVKHVVRPYLVGIEQSLGLALLTEEERGRYKFEFNVEGLLRGDFKSRMEGYALLIQWGVATINEVRRRENLPPVDGGDVRLTPLSYAPADRIMDVLLKEPTAGKRALEELLHELRPERIAA